MDCSATLELPLSLESAGVVWDETVDGERALARFLAEAARCVCEWRPVVYRILPRRAHARAQTLDAVLPAQPEQKESLCEAYRKFLELPPERRQAPKPDTIDKRPCPPC